MLLLRQKGNGLFQFGDAFLLGSNDPVFLFRHFDFFILGPQGFHKHGITIAIGGLEVAGSIHLDFKREYIWKGKQK